jgi:phosphoenolpyruvate carboxykinase (GTP)
MADYFGHWLKLGAQLAAGGAKLPKIYCVNWFRKGADGKFVWPGYGDNMRVLEWILRRAEGTAGGEDNLFGVSPRYDDLSWSGLDFSRAQYQTVTSFDHDAWRTEMGLHGELFTQLASRLPPELLAIKAGIERKLAA